MRLYIDAKAHDPVPGLYHHYPDVITDHDDLAYFAPYYQHVPILLPTGKPEPAS